VFYFSQAVHEKMEYMPLSTNPRTTAREAFLQKRGVCQDFAHILLSLLRLEKIPCRYIAGLASDYGETHAWVEAEVNGKFYGIDPTRNKFIDENYLTLTRGRDFDDCAIERGVLKGFCRGFQKIDLKMRLV
jgi:transglutaminase-like putative cysteine protease